VDEQSWKKEFTLERKLEGESEDATPASEETPEPVAEEPVAEEPVAEEALWKRKVSLSPKPEGEPVTEETVAEEPVAEEPVAEEPAAEEPMWKREVSFSRNPEEEPVAGEGLAEEPVAEEPVWKRAISFSPDPEREPVAGVPLAEEPAPEPEPVVEEPVAEESEAETEETETTQSVPFWKKDISFGGKKRDKAPKPEPVAEVEVAAVAEEPGEKVPFWKKDISFGGKKTPKAPKAPKTAKERRAKEPKVKAPRGGSSKGRIVGLKIGASQLAAARVANNGSAELQQVAREPLAPGIVVGGELRDPEALSAALKDFFAKHKLPTKGVRLGIANNRVGVRTFEIAGITEQKQLDNAIRFRAQEALPIPIDEAVLDYQVLGEGTDEEGQPTRRVLLVVAYRELIDRYVGACRKAGIVLSGIDLEAFALLRALQAPQTGVGNDPSAALVAVAIGHERSTFAVSDGRVCEFTRVLEWGGSALNVALARVLDAAPSEVEDVKHELTLTNSTVPDGLTPEQASRCVEALRKAIQTFARELVSSLQYYQNQPGSLGIGEIVLTGGTAHLPGLAGELESLIGVRVRVGNPLARMKVAKRVGEPERIGSLAVAIGLGIDD
jgi:type IV pilus assembly protein PilM